MTPAFWDSSALVPLCVQQQPSAHVRELLDQHGIIVWWATPVEMRSAFERLLRMRALTIAEYTAAGVRLDKLRRIWSEVPPSSELRAEAEKLLAMYSLKAADALQLAAATIWSAGTPQSCTFLSGDVNLLDAARQLAFQVVTV